MRGFFHLKKFSPLSWLPPLRLLLPAVVSGVLLALAFPPTAWGFLSFVALAPMLVALGRGRFTPREYFRTGYSFGFAFFFVTLRWIVDLVPASSITIPWLMWPALALLVIYLSVWPGLCFLALRVLGRGGRLTVVLLLPALWYFSERLRSGSEFGFPWGIVGYSLAFDPAVLQLVAFIGIFGLGAVVVLVNALWSEALVSRTRLQRLLFLFAGAAVVIAATLGGRARIARFDAKQGNKGRTVVIVQPNIDLEIKWKKAYTDSTFRVIERMCHDAAPLDPALIIFPETAAPIYIRHDKTHSGTLARIARDLETQIYIGFLDGRYDGPDDALRVYNSSGVFGYRGTPGGFEQYDKIHLLPFGEAVPYAWKFPFLSKLDFGQANFAPGPKRRPLPTDAGSIAPMICFESIFPDLARDAVANGADLLVNITNDGWFGDSPGPVQHNAMAIPRAVENGRYLVRSSNTGISMVVDPAGRIVTSLGLFEKGIVAARIRPGKGRTFYTRFGDGPATVVAFLMLGAGILLARRGKLHL